MATTWQSVRLAVCTFTAALAVVSCSSGHHSTASAAPHLRITPPPTSPTASATPDPHSPSVHKAPPIHSDGITPLVSDAAVKGNATYTIPGGIKAGKTLAIAINCQGKGRLTVQVEPANVSFPLLCEKGKVLPTMNEIHMSKNRPTGSLRFTSEPNLTWSFAVGWDPHPPEEK
ncbi:hypothetical protein AB0B52_14845 [Streptomyces griseofuscus]|uniref:hypothetical protein n=1 Tax=Streptomyces griseofuscus TaxID=146922 RepID=UPI0033F4AFAA